MRMRWGMIVSALIGLGAYVTACGSAPGSSDSGGDTGSSGHECTPRPCEIPCYSAGQHPCLDGVPYPVCVGLGTPLPEWTSCNGDAGVCSHGLCVLCEYLDGGC
jgi:hypothetical protein